MWTHEERTRAAWERPPHPTPLAFIAYGSRLSRSTGRAEEAPTRSSTQMAGRHTRPPQPQQARGLRAQMRRRWARALEKETQ